jgi:hypothetical protein
MHSQLSEAYELRPVNTPAKFEEGWKSMDCFSRYYESVKGLGTEERRILQVKKTNIFFNWLRPCWRNISEYGSRSYFIYRSFWKDQLLALYQDLFLRMWRLALRRSRSHTILKCTRIIYQYFKIYGVFDRSRQH